MRFCCEVRGQASCLGWWRGLGGQGLIRSGLSYRLGLAKVAAARGFGLDGMELGVVSRTSARSSSGLRNINTECGCIVRIVSSLVSNSTIETPHHPINISTHEPHSRMLRDQLTSTVHIKAQIPDPTLTSTIEYQITLPGLPRRFADHGMPMAATRWRSGRQTRHAAACER